MVTPRLVKQGVSYLHESPGLMRTPLLIPDRPSPRDSCIAGRSNASFESLLNKNSNTLLWQRLEQNP